jgi:hypothetical protein
MPSHSHEIAVRRLEDLPSDGGQTVDTLAGGLLRTFIRLNALEAALARITSRVAALEVASAGAGPGPKLVSR